jgi:hypothetical protein
MTVEDQFRKDIGEEDAPEILKALHLPDIAWWSQRLFRWSNRGRRMLVVATIALLGWSVLQQLDLGLTRMHVNDVKAYGPASLVGPSLDFPKPWDDAVDTWNRYQVLTCRAAPPEGVAPRECTSTIDTSSLNPQDALFRHVVVDTLFFMYPSAAVLWFLLWRAWRRARPSDAVEGPLQQVAALTLVLPAVALGLDAVENVGIAVIAARWTDGVGDVFIGVLSAITLAKWLCILLILVVLAVVTLRLYFEPDSTLRAHLGHTVRRLVALRAQLITAGSVAMLLGLSLFSADLGNQLLDVMVRWLEQWATGALAFAALVLLTAILVVTGRLSLRDYDGASTAPAEMSSGAPLVAAGIGAVAIVLGMAFPEERWAFLPAGVLLLLFAALSAPDRVRQANPTSVAFAEGGGWVYPFLVAVPGWVFAILLTRVAVTLEFQQGSGAHTVVFTGLCVLAAVIAVSGAHAAHGYERWQTSIVDTVVTVGVIAGAAVVVVVCWVIGIVDPLGFGVDTGALAIVGLFATGFCLVLVGLTTIGNHVRAKGPLAVLQFRRVPVVALVLAFVVVGSALDDDARMHDVRLDTKLTVEPVKLDEAWQAWVDKVPDDGSAVPMVFVASTGGGIRAAYWTTAAMGCLFGHAPPSDPANSDAVCAPDANVKQQRVFLASGISGGSLGLVAQFAGASADASPRLRADFVSPVISQLLLVDTPNALLRNDDVDDRAVILERAWEDAWRDTKQNPLRQDLFAWQRDHLGTKPLLVLNGATIEDGCRMAATALDTAVTAAAAENAKLPLADRSCTSLTPFLTGTPGAGQVDPALVRTTSLYDLSCGVDDSTRHDVKLSTAALLSARFPVVSPTGGLYRCGSKGKDDTKNARLSDVDGGAIETSGAKPVEEVFAQLAPLIQTANAQRNGCIRPRLILLDNNYVSSERSDPAGHQLESQLLLQAKGIGGKGLTAAARQEAALAFDHFFAGTCPSASTAAACANSVAYIVPSEHPGVRAPLGWTLSKVSADDMDRQLTGDWNRSQLKLARSWFAPDAC